MGKYAIFLVLALTFSMLTYSYALKNSIFISNNRNIENFSQNQAHNIAQGIAMLTIMGMQSGDDSYVPNKNQTITFPGVAGSFEFWEEMNGYYRFETENLGDTLVVIRSHGKFDNTVYEVSAGVTMGTAPWNPVFDQTVHAENSIELGGDDLIYGDATLNSTNNDAVKLGSQSKTKIDGNLYIGPGGNKDNVVVGNHQNVGGDIHNMPRKQNYDMPIFPNFPEGFLDSGRIINSSETITPEEYSGYIIDEIDLGNNSKLQIETNGEDQILYTRKLNVHSADVEILGGGNLTIYVERDLDMKGRGKVNENGDPGQVMLYYKGNQEVELYDETLDFGGNTYFNGSLFAEKASISLFGTAGIQGNVMTGGPTVNIRGNSEAISRFVFAPHANVIANGNVTIRGAVVADTFKGSGNTLVHYESEFDSPVPDLEVEGNFKIAWWN